MPASDVGSVKDDNENKQTNPRGGCVLALERPMQIPEIRLTNVYQISKEQPKAADD